jgi:ketosteroid isomerase-like protein
MLSEADRNAIERAFEEVMRRFGAPVKDWPAFVESAYDEDAIVMPPNGPAVRGRAAMLAFLEAFPPFSNHQQTTLEMDGAGDFAYLRDVVSVTVLPPGATPLQEMLKVITIWRKQADGSWKIYREIWNSDLPAAAPPAQALG